MHAKQMHIDSKRAEGKVGIAGHIGKYGDLTHEEYPEAERNVKQNQAQYDREKGEPVTHGSAPGVMYMHEPGASVLYPAAIHVRDPAVPPQYEEATSTEAPDDRKSFVQTDSVGPPEGPPESETPSSPSEFDA